MSRPDYQGTLGFELVTVELEDQMALHLIREDGADDREATLTERVLWSSLVETLAALQEAADYMQANPPANGWGLLDRSADNDRCDALSKARAALKSNGWQA